MNRETEVAIGFIVAIVVIGVFAWQHSLIGVGAGVFGLINVVRYAAPDPPKDKR